MEINILLYRKDDVKKLNPRKGVIKDWNGKAVISALAMTKTVDYWADCGWIYEIID